MSQIPLTLKDFKWTDLSDIELYVSVHSCTIQCLRINACFESLPHGLFLTCRGENIFRCREVYGMHNDNNECDKEFKRKVCKALLLKVAALCTRMRTSTRTGSMLWIS
jgi:hypothetical protein